MELFSLTFEVLLAFATGAPTPPPAGFSPEPTLTFGHTESVYPKSNTCSNKLIIPIVKPFPTTDDFCHFMAYGITNSAEFGRV